MRTTARLIACRVAGLSAAGLVIGSGHAHADSSSSTAENLRKLEARVKAVEANPSMKAGSSIIDAIGNTPLVEMKSLSQETGCRVLLKMENMNPGGSVKDRAALFLIEEAEKQGLLKPGGSITEGTGGNTGIGLALVANAKV